MDVEGAKLIAAALALLPIFGVGIGLGLIFNSAIQAMGRNPQAADVVRMPMLLGFAVTEALGIFALLIAFVILGK